MEEHRKGKMQIGIVVDDWKVQVFRRHLDEGRYDYTEHPGLTEGTMTFKVYVSGARQIAELSKVVRAAKDECDRMRRANH